MNELYMNKLEKLETGKWVFKSLILTLCFYGGLIIGAMIEQLGKMLSIGFIATAGTDIAAFFTLIYFVLLLPFYIKSGVGGYTMRLAKDAALSPIRVTGLIIFALPFFLFSLLLAGFILQLAFLLPVVMTLLARRKWKKLAYAN